MDPLILTKEMITVFAILGLVIILLVFNLLRVDVAVASINTFMLPTHQVNALIMQPGGYKTSDYMRVGSGMMVIFLVILMVMLKLFY